MVQPGTVLDRRRALNPRSYMELAPLGRAVGVVFLVLALAWRLQVWVGSSGDIGDGS